MNRLTSTLSAIGTGALLMYFYDPDRGRRRRALLKDQLNRATCNAEDFFEVAARDARNRGRGIASQTRSLLRRGHADGSVLVARVRSKLGRIVSHPHALRVSADGSEVTLAGPILAHEADEALACARRVAGVSGVRDQLDRHQNAEHVPALQGGQPRRGDTWEFAQQNWSPSARVTGGAAGAAVVAYALAQRSFPATLLGMLGLGLLLRSATNMEVRQLMGRNGSEAGIKIDKTIQINAPVEDVFQFWSRPENFPRFMRHVREVTGSVQGVTHWVVDGAAGMPMTWTAECCDYVANQRICWRTQPGSAVRHQGSVRFDACPDGSTRVHIEMEYVPPAGAIGHGLARLLGVDPKSQLDDDMMRVKTLIESGHIAHDAAQASAKAADASGVADYPRANFGAAQTQRQVSEPGL